MASSSTLTSDLYRIIFFAFQVVECVAISYEWTAEELYGVSKARFLVLVHLVASPKEMKTLEKSVWEMYGNALDWSRFVRPCNECPVHLF